MKAAVLKQLGSAPVYSDFEDPIAQGDDQVILNIKAAALKNFDKLRASAGNYASFRELPVVVGNDGVGTLQDGTNVYAQGITGMIAEKAIISKNKFTILPQGIDLSLAASLPNALLGSAMALQTRGKIKTGDVVVINGATGVTGQLAVQLAKHFGASMVIATGRNEEGLQKLKTLGADATISLKGNEETIISTLKEISKENPVDIVIDYLWGRPVELIIESLKTVGINPNPHKVRIVTVGDMAGHNIALNSGMLRSSDIEVLGSGFGTFSPKELMEFGAKILPEMFALAAKGKLKLDTHNESIENIGKAWHNKADGKRTVIVIG
ncbi:MAG: zinc-binding dehydrogenase [Chryseolinea sp.]